MSGIAVILILFRRRQNQIAQMMTMMAITPTTPPATPAITGTFEVLLEELAAEGLLDPEELPFDPEVLVF